MAKFDNVKVGDRVWSLIYGWGVVTCIESLPCLLSYPIKVTFDNGVVSRYTKSGYHSTHQLYPELFWNEVKLPKEEEDKPPFDVAEFLQQNASCVEFEYGEKNYYLCYDGNDKKLAYSYCVSVDYLGAVYLDSSNFRYIVGELNKNKITPQQVKEAYKRLGWL